MAGGAVPKKSMAGLYRIPEGGYIKCYYVVYDINVYRPNEAFFKRGRRGASLVKYTVLLEVFDRQIRGQVYYGLSCFRESATLASGTVETVELSSEHGTRKTRVNIVDAAEIRKSLPLYRILTSGMHILLSSTNSNRSNTKIRRDA